MPEEGIYMRTLKTAGLILAGMLFISSAAFAHGGGGGGGGGHGGGGFGGGHGGGGFGGGHFGGGHSGGGHFGGGHFGGTHFAAGHFGGHYGWRGGHWYGGRWYGGGWYPYYDDYGYDGADAYNGDESAYYDTTSNGATVADAQRELAKLGYYHGSIDGVIGPETEKAVSWFQSVDKLPVTGQLDDQTLQALQVS